VNDPTHLSDEFAAAAGLTQGEITRWCATISQALKAKGITVEVVAGTGDRVLKLTANAHIPIEVLIRLPP
jgi:hypothetical protein